MGDMTSEHAATAHSIREKREHSAYDLIDTHTMTATQETYTHTMTATFREGEEIEHITTLSAEKRNAILLKPRQQHGECRHNAL